MANLVLSTSAGAVTAIKVPVQGTKANGEEGVVFFSFKMPMPLSRTEDLIAVLEGTMALPKGVVLPSVIKVSSPAVTGTGGLVFRISRSPTPAELAAAIRDYCGMAPAGADDDEKASLLAECLTLGVEGVSDRNSLKTIRAKLEAHKLTAGNGTAS